MLRILRVALLFASSTSALDAEPYANYGFYSPYPPPPDQVIYDFAPVQVDGDGRGGRHRSARDSAWRDEFGALLDGDREPTCEQLREMWHYARSLQQRAARGRQGAAAEGDEPSSSSRLPPFVAFSPLEGSQAGKSGGAAASSGPHPKPKPPRQANRRRMSTPPNTPGRGRPRPRPRPPKVAVSAPPAKVEAKQQVYGVIKTHAPSKTTMHVRDPAKEIYGLLNEEAHLASSAGDSAAEGEDRVYGQVRTHAQPTRRPSYMSILEKELYGERDEDDGRDSFGSVKYEVPSASENEIPATSSFERVRALLAAEGDLGDFEAYDAGDGPFDLIRQRLMNSSPSSSSASSKLRSKEDRALRRKTSRKTKQRNVSET